MTPRGHSGEYHAAPMRRLARLLPVLASLLASACITRVAGFHGKDDVPGALHLSEVSVPEAARPLMWTVYPTPRAVEYGELLLPLDGARFVDDAAAGFSDLLRRQGLDLGWKELPREGYLIAVTAENGRTVVLKAARDDAGKRWADQAFAQLMYETPSRKYVRECRVLDAPVFALRGNKRPLAWETNYRANFAWGAKDDPEFRGRTMTAVYAPGIPLDATGAGVARALDFFRPWQDRGVRFFAVKFDDEGFALTPESELRHGRFAPALVNYLRLVRQGLRRRDADARLYLLPQTYWWTDPRLDVLAASLRGAGGLDEDVGLVMTGPEIVSSEIDAEGLAAARRAFGLTETKALIYDNLGREGDWGPLVGRGSVLARFADGVFGERGTPVHRLTRLDWLWNPDGYDPEKSWRRAILELAGPRDFERFTALCKALRDPTRREDVAGLLAEFEAKADGSWKGPIAREQLVALVRADCARFVRPPAAAGRAD
jgi:hypothetical protein